MVDAETKRHFHIFPAGHPEFMTRSCKKKVLYSKMMEADAFGSFETADGSRCSVDEQTMALVQGACAGDPRQRARAYGQARSNPKLGIGKLMGSRNLLPLPSERRGAGGGGGGGAGGGGWGWGEDDAEAASTLLRIRAFPGRTLPEFSEGDVIVGVSLLWRRNDGALGGVEASRSEQGGEGMQGVDEDDEEEDESYGDTRSFKVLEVSWGYKAYANLEVDGASARGGAASEGSTSTSRSRSSRNCVCVCREIKRAG
jgi:hypothetical protein